MSDRLAIDGFVLAPGIVEKAGLEYLVASLGPVAGGGRRGLLGDPVVAALVTSERFLALARPHLTGMPIPVRTIYFDKSANANWLVPWHQDLTIAVRDRAEIEWFGPWSSKEGIPHVQPPIELLQNMVTLRLHLDDTDETNGALKVLPGTHNRGRLSKEDIAALRENRTEHLFSASAGDVLLMRPLLLHASSRSTAPRHRQILHIEYAGFYLPEGLAWAEAD